MLIYLFTSSILLFVFALGYYLFVRQAPTFALRRRVLLMGMAGVLCLPFCPAPTIPQVLPEQISVTDAVSEWEIYTLNTAQHFIAAADVPSDNSTLRTMVSRVFSPQGALILGYRFILLLFLGRLILGLLRIYRIHQRSSPSGEPDVRIVEGRGEAFTFGRTVYVSDTVYNSVDVSVILAHERAHARQLHTIDALLLELIRAVFWFHPMAWWTRRQVQLNLEYLADAEVLRAGFDRRAYQLSLIAHQQGTDFRTSLLPQFAATGLKRRIKMMMFQPGAKGKAFFATGLLVFAGFFTFVCLTGQTTSPLPDTGEASAANPGISPLFNGEAVQLNAYFKRLPTPDEVAKIRPYLKGFFGTDLLVFQPCTEPTGTYRLFLGSTEGSGAGSTNWSTDYYSDDVLRFQLTKDGNGGTGGASFRPTPPPADAPDEDVLLSVNGEWIPVEVPGSRPYDAATLDRRIRAAELECHLGLTPENKDEYNTWNASGKVLAGEQTLDVANNKLSANRLLELPRTYFIGEREVDDATFNAHQSGTLHMLYMAARTDGENDRMVLMVRE